jgi:hypothetical protein
MRRVGLVAGIGQMSHIQRNYFGRTEGKFHFDSVDMNGRVISNRITRTQGIKGNPLFIWLMTGTTGGLECIRN